MTSSSGPVHTGERLLLHFSSPEIPRPKEADSPQSQQSVGRSKESFSKDRKERTRALRQSEQGAKKEDLRTLNTIDEKMNDETSIQKAAEEINKGRKPPLVLSGKVFTNGQPDFRKNVEFIKGSSPDYPLNATIDENKVSRIVVMTVTKGELKGESVVVALDKDNKLLGMAD